MSSFYVSKEAQLKLMKEIFVSALVAMLSRPGMPVICYR